MPLSRPDALRAARRACAVSAFAASLGLAFAPGSAAAQDPVEPEEFNEEAFLADGEGSNVTSYPPSFFAEFRPNTAMDMINRLPGFSFEGGSGARGFAGTAGNVLIDGARPPSRSDSLSEVLGRVPASAVARIDIVRGGTGGIDMQGRSVVANVIRKPGGGITGAVTGGLNVALNGHASPYATTQVQRQANGRLVEGSLAVYRNMNGNEGLRYRINPDGSVREYLAGTNGYDSWRYEAAGAFETTVLGGKFRLNASANMQVNDNRDQGRFTVPLGDEFSLSGNERIAGEAGLRYSRNILGAEFEGVLFQSRSHNESESESVRRAFTNGNLGADDGGETIGSVSVRLPKWGNWAFETGGETAFNFTETVSARTLNGAPFGLAGDASRVEELRSEIFGTATWTPTGQLSVESAVRYETSTITATSNAGGSEKSLEYVKPRMNVSWTPKSGHQFNLRVERFVDQLSFGAFASSVSFNSSLDTSVIGIGNLDLEPEQSWIYDLRYERRWGGQNSIVAQIVWRDIENQLTRAIVPAPTLADPARVAEITKNGEAAWRSQVNLSANLELDRWGIPGGLLNLSVNIRDSETIDGVTGLPRKQGGETPFSWNSSFSQNIQRLNLRWSISLEGDTENVNFQPRSISVNQGEYSLRANFSWKPRPDLTVGGGVNNIGGGSGRSRTVFYDAPRNVGAPLYYETRYGNGVPTAFVSLRKSL